MPASVFNLHEEIIRPRAHAATDGQRILFREAERAEPNGHREFSLADCLVDVTPPSPPSLPAITTVMISSCLFILAFDLIIAG